MASYYRRQTDEQTRKVYFQCTGPQCMQTYATTVSTTTLRKHTMTHYNQPSYIASARSSSANNSALNEKISDILARLRLPPMIVDRPEFRIDLVDLLRSTTKSVPCRQTVADHTVKLATKYRQRIVRRLVEWNEPVTITADGNCIVHF
jgi:hypothetical protein